MPACNATAKPAIYGLTTALSTVTTLSTVTALSTLNTLSTVTTLHSALCWIMKLISQQGKNGHGPTVMEVTILPCLPRLLSSWHDRAAWGPLEDLGQCQPDVARLSRRLVVTQHPGHSNVALTATVQVFRNRGVEWGGTPVTTSPQCPLAARCFWILQGYALLTWRS